MLLFLFLFFVRFIHFVHEPTASLFATLMKLLSLNNWSKLHCFRLIAIFGIIKVNFASALAPCRFACLSLAWRYGSLSWKVWLSSEAVYCWYRKNMVFLYWIDVNRGIGVIWLVFCEVWWGIFCLRNEILGCFWVVGFVGEIRFFWKNGV